MAVRHIAILVLVIGFGAFLYTRGVLQEHVAAGSVTVSVPDDYAAKMAFGNPVILRIVGTSLTTRGDWTGKLEAALNRCGSRPIIVDRVALAGASSTFAQINLDRIVGKTDLPKPDIVAIEFSSNDASLYHGMSVAGSRTNHRNLVETLISNDIGVALATMNPAFGRKAWERPGQDAYHSIYRELAATHSVILIDTIAAWRALTEEERDLYLPDGLHPTTEAMEQITVPAFLEAFGPVFCD